MEYYHRLLQYFLKIPFTAAVPTPSITCIAPHCLFVAGAAFASYITTWCSSVTAAASAVPTTAAAIATITTSVKRVHFVHASRLLISSIDSPSTLLALPPERSVPVLATSSTTQCTGDHHGIHLNVYCCSTRHLSRTLARVNRLGRSRAGQGGWWLRGRQAAGSSRLNKCGLLLSCHLHIQPRQVSVLTLPTVAAAFLAAPDAA